MKAHKLMALLTSPTHVRAVLRPDIVTLPVVGYPEHLKYPNFRDPRRAKHNDPLPRVLTPNTDLLTIDEYLGTYNPTSQWISIFDENIHKAAEMLCCREDDLRDVVRFHEHAHAAIHLGVTEEEKTQSLLNGRYRASRLRQLTAVFTKIDPFLHEHLAQLVTYHALKTLSNNTGDNQVCRDADRMLDVFHRLMRRQPPAYQVDLYLEVPSERLKGTIRMIKEGALVGKFAPWKEIMNWK